MTIHRKILALAAMGALLLNGAVAAAQEPVPKEGGILRYAVSDDPANFDCHAANHFAALMRLAPHYSTLLRFKPGSYPEIEGDLTDSWEANPADLTYTFKLRQGVKFHDGSDLKAADIAATYDRLTWPPEGVVSERLETFRQIEKIDVVDDYTVRFKLKEWDESVLGTFASPYNCVYSAALLKSDASYPKEKVMGSGPFVFDEFISGSVWKSSKFEDYFREGQPYLDGLESYTMEGPAVVNAIQSGQIHTDFRGVSPQGADRLKQSLGDGISIESGPALTHFLVTFNAEKPPFDDERVRRALNLAIDRWGGVKGLGRTTEMRYAGGIFLPGGQFAASDAELQKMAGFGTDIAAAREEAKRLLKEAGQENLSFDLTVRNGPPIVVDFGVFLADQWRQIGVNARNVVVETPPWAAALSEGSYQVIIDIYSALREEPTEQMTKYVSHDVSARSAGRFTDRELDDLWHKQTLEQDKAKRMALLRTFESRLYEKSYSVPVVWLERIVAMNAALKGWTFNPSNFLYLDQSSTWLDE
jgi:peptide/nickel transport system substrate-binding protein